MFGAAGHWGRSCASSSRMSVVYAVRKRKQLGGIVHAEIYILYGDETNKAKKMDHEKC